MISRVVYGRGLVNNFGFFSYLKDRYKREKVFHIFNQIDCQQMDETKKLNFQKALILIRNDIDGRDRVGIQAIKLYLDYLFIQENQLLRGEQIQSDDHIFYKNISDKCANVDLIKQATIMSKIFYYLNGGDFKLLSLQLEFDLLLRKIVCLDSTDKFEQICLQDRLKEVLDRLVKYTIKHYSNSDYQLLQTLLKQYAYHMLKSQQYMNERSYQEALDELVVAQTQLNDLWSKLSNQDSFRVDYQRLIIKKLLITGQAKYLLKQDDGFEIILNALNMYVDDIGMDEEYYEKFTEIVKFLHNFDKKGCLQLLERIHKHDLNLQRLVLEQIRIIMIYNLDQLKMSDVDSMIDLYSKLENRNDAVDYEYFIFFYNMKKLLEDFESAHKYLELILQNLQLQSHIEQSRDIVKITLAISYQQLIKSPNAHQIYDICMQMLEKSCFRLKDNFDQLSFEDQIRTINTERTIIIIQSDIDKLSILQKQQSAGYQNTLNRLQHLDDKFQANQQFRLPVLEILKDLGIQEKEIYEQIDNLRQIILDTDILK